MTIIRNKNPWTELVHWLEDTIVKTKKERTILLFKSFLFLKFSRKED